MVSLILRQIAALARSVVLSVQLSLVVVVLLVQHSLMVEVLSLQHSQMAMMPFFAPSILGEVRL